jgi:hypothetical protein
MSTQLKQILTNYKFPTFKKYALSFSSYFTYNYSESLLKKLPPIKFFFFQQSFPADGSEAIMRAKAYVAFEKGNYRELYSILQVSLLRILKTLCYTLVVEGIYFQIKSDIEYNIVIWKRF